MFSKRRTGVSEPAFHRSSTQNRCFWVIYKIYSKNPVSKSLFNRLFLTLQFWGPATLLRKTSTLMLSCKVSKIFKNNYFEEHLWTSASKPYLKRYSNTGVFMWILWTFQKRLICKGSTNDWFWNTCAWVSL